MQSKTDIDDIEIKPFEQADLDAIMEIENDSFPLPWTRKSYEEVIPLDTIDTWVAVAGEELVGYMLLQHVADEMELHTFAVKASWRRKGVGMRLMECMISEGERLNIKNIYLMVRPNNVPARTLYEKLGFKTVGIRKKYYHDNDEDALVMRMSMAAGASSSNN